MKMHNNNALLFLTLFLIACLAPAAITAAGINPSPGTASYSCGRASDVNPLGVPKGSRVCFCDKSVAGDCKAMEDEACNSGFLTCKAGETLCWCKEKSGGPSTRTVNRNNRKAVTVDTLAPIDRNSAPNQRRQSPATLPIRVK